MSLSAHCDATARAAERLVGGARHIVGDRHRVVVEPGGHEARVVGHIDHELRPNLAGDLCERAVGNLTGVGTRARHDELRLVLTGEPRHLIEVEAVVLTANTIVDKVVEDARGVELHAVREVAAVGQIEGKHGVACLQSREIDRGVGLAAGMRLHVHVLGPEETLEPVAGEVLDLVHELAAAVVPPARIALGVLVREHAPHRLHDGRAREVLTGDHLEAFLLTHLFGGHGRPNLGIILFEKIHGGPPQGALR